MAKTSKSVIRIIRDAYREAGYGEDGFAKVYSEKRKSGLRRVKFWLARNADEVLTKEVKNRLAFVDGLVDLSIKEYTTELGVSSTSIVAWVQE